jgi:hypothetical protein
MSKITLNASPTTPVIIYYCKAGIPTGKTIRISQSGKIYQCSNVALHNCDAAMHHDNATSKAKASGARCTLNVDNGEVSFHE